MNNKFTLPLLAILLGLPGAWMRSFAQECTTPFLTPASLPVGQRPFSVVSGDFNGDSHLDLAVTNSTDNTISVIPGHGTGSFGTAVNYAVGNTPRELTTGDFNNDGKLDLAVVNNGSYTVSILINNNNEGFNEAVSYTVGYDPVNIISGDFNGDGWSDLATTITTPIELVVLLNDKQGNFDTKISSSLPQMSGGLASGDFNNDGNLDVVLVTNDLSYSSTNNLSVLPGNGSGTFSTAASYEMKTSSLSVISGDFNGDGATDIAAANSRGTMISIRINNGSGGFESVTEIEVGAQPITIATADFNGDGKADLVVNQMSIYVISVLLGEGNGNFTKGANYDTERDPRWLTTGDFNEDNKPDIALTNNSSNSVSIFQGDGNGGVHGAMYYAAGPYPSSIIDGDFNGDNKPDMAVLHRDEINISVDHISILLNNGQGGFHVPITLNVRRGTNSITSGDFNNDGKLDLAIVDASTKSVLLGNGDGSFATPAYFTVVGTAYFVTAGKFNNDTNTDLVIAIRNPDGSYAAAVVMGNGNGTFGVPAYFAVGSYPCAIATGDFNNDEKADLAVVNRVSENISVLFGNGDGGFSAATNIVVGTTPRDISTGDFNGDNKLDLAVANYSSNNISVLLNNGVGSFNKTDWAAGTHPLAVMSLDFNGDGKMDIAVANSDADAYSLTMMPGDRSGNFNTLSFLKAGYSPFELINADFDGNGSSDIATTNNNSYGVSLLFNTCKGFVSPGNIVYVNKNAMGNKTGNSWADAYTSLQDALAQANVYANIKQIWVAAGTYFPDEGTGLSDNSRSQSFVLKSGLALYGGFSGSEDHLEQHNPGANVTILSGDIDGNNALTGNSYHVVQAINVDNTAVLDGFTVSGGNANGSASIDKQGGGMYNNHASATISNCIFTGNSASSYGGGLINLGSSAPSITDCAFTANIASTGGGIENFSSSPTLTNCSFIQNVATNSSTGGGGIYNSSSSPAFTNCSFAENSAANGGGIYNSGSSPSLNTCSFAQNVATAYGGAFYNASSSPTLIACSFLQNQAANGGAMDNYNYSSPALSNCEFSQNTATTNAGAVFNGLHSSSTFTSCRFTDNHSGTGGGGIYSDNSNPIVTACNFSGNSAVAYGGGMANAYTSTAIITNSSFSGNSSANGGGIENFRSSPSIINCSFTANTGTIAGGGIYNNTASPAVTNCILWGDIGGEISNANSSAPTVRYSLVQSGYTGGTNILDKDPLFVNVANIDLNLEKCSPAVNVGLNSANTTITDIAGNNRIYDGTLSQDFIDLGAYELQAEGSGALVVSTVVPGKYSLAPPNHKMQDVTLNYMVTGGCSPLTTVTVKSSEPVNGTGDGDTQPDWIIHPANPYHVQLRAERAAQGDGRIYTITVTTTDISGSNTQDVQVHVAHNITAPVSGAAFKLGTTVSLAGTFWDKAGTTHTAKWLIDDNINIKGTVAEPTGVKNGKVTGSYRFPGAGIYKLQMNVTDQNGATGYANTSGDLEAIVVVYNPSGGYAYGGGYFNSPAGTLTSNPQATGKVSYGFVVNYFKGATLPKGETQFEFKVGELEYNALNFEYLAVDGAKAQFRGTGKITGGQSGINFIMTVVDGALDGSGIDKVRMKIFNKNTGLVYYDNEPGVSDAANPTTVVGAGSTVVIQSASPTRPNVRTEMVTVQQPTDLQLKVLPNPTHNMFDVFVRSDNSKEIITLQIFDQWGRKIEERTMGGELTQIGATYRPGTYFVRIVQADKHREVKVIKLAE
jgi:hypothetical protein